MISINSNQYTLQVGIYFYNKYPQPDDTVLPFSLQIVIEKPITEWFNVKCHKIYCYRYLIDGILLFFFLSFRDHFLPKSIFHSRRLCIFVLRQHKKNSIFMTKVIIQIIMVLLKISQIFFSLLKKNGFHIT